MEEKDKIEQITIKKHFIETLEQGIVEIKESFKLIKEDIALLQTNNNIKTKIIINLYTALIHLTKKNNIKELNIEELEKSLQTFKSIEETEK
jgi:hypothetical protein